MINNFTFVGNLTRDAEMRYGSTGLAICKFAIAVNRRRKEREDETHFFDCVILGNFAEAINSYLTKGQKVAVSGEVQQSRWQDKDTGANRSKVEFLVQNLELVGGKRDSQQEQATRKVFEDDMPI